MKRIVYALMMLSLWPAWASAQNAEARQRIEEERRSQFDQMHELQSVLDEGFFYDYGGWWRSSVFHTEDTDNVDRAFRDQDARFFLDLRYGTIHQMYIRVKGQYTDNNAGDAGSEFEEDDFAGINGDQIYWKVDLDQLFDTDKMKGDFMLGRQFLRVGDGFTFNGVYDGVYVKTRFPKYSLEVSAAKSIRGQADFDSSRPKAHESKRNFYSGQFTWHGFDKHTPFAYMVVQRDKNNGNEWQPGQGFDFDTEHYGLGSDGEFLIPKLHYHTEIIKEEGRSHATGSTQAEDIDAWAFEGKLDYTWATLWMKPRINFGFLIGSGDRDRRSITATVFGNRLGSKDENFIEYGFTDLGYALSPRLANLKVWNFGTTFKPLNRWEMFWKSLKNLEVGTQVYVYQKLIANSVISDATATLRDKDIGLEWDLYTNWQITSDLFFTAQYGRFHPGEAYPQRDKRHYFTMYITFSF